MRKTLFALMAVLVSAPFAWAADSVVPSGTIAQAIVNNHKAEIAGGTWVTLYSEATICAQESMMVKLYSGETLLGTTELVDKADGETELLTGTSLTITWHFFLAGQDDWWTTTWVKEPLTADLVPDRVELWADGVNVAESTVYLSNSNDNMGAATVLYNWGDIPGVKVAQDANGTSYETLAAAINGANGAAITLLGDTTDDMLTVVAGQTAVIDFNGFTLQGSMMVEKGATASLSGGTITQVDTVAGIEVQGVATLTNMNISSARHAIRVDGLNSEGTSVTIDGGTYQTKAPTGWTAHTINAGEGSTVTIKGGTFIGAGEANAGGSGNCVMVKDATTTVAIEGGRFYGSNGVEGCICAANKLTISGGTFSTWTYDKYLSTEKNYVVEKNADGMYEVVEATNWIQVADASWYKANATAFTLSTAKQLAGVAKLVNEGTTFDGVEITLEGNLDLSGLVWPGIGTYSKKNPTLAFRGTFDGVGYTIKGVTFADNGSDDLNEYRGFFNQMYNATVKNLTVEGNGFVDTISGSYGCAMIAGHIFNSTLSNCVAKGTIASSTHNAAGIVVRISSDESRVSEVIDCRNEADITCSYTKVGGIAALTQNVLSETLIKNCVNTGTLTTTDGSWGIGGILGWNGYADTVAPAACKDVILENCSNTGAISGGNSAIIGQLIGKAEAYLKDGGANKGLTTMVSVGNGTDKGFFYATVAEEEDGTLIANYVNTLEAGKTYLVVNAQTKPVIELAPGQSITFDTTLATINASGITATPELMVKEEGKTVTYTAAVVMLDDKPYASLQDAIDAATAGQTVKPLADIELSAMLTIAADKDIILDLNGHAITVIKNGNSLYAFNNFGTLTLKDSSEEQTGSITARGVKNNGVLTLDSGTIYTCDTNGGYGVWNRASAEDGSIIAVESATFIMNGGAIKTTHHVGIESWVASPTCLRNATGATAILKDGVLESTNVAVYVVISVGTLNVPEGSTVSVTGPRGVAIDAGSATINGGSFSTTPTTEWKGWYVLYVHADGANVTINDGYFYADNIFSVNLGENNNATVTSTITINGGTFDKPVSARGTNHTDALTITGGKFLNWDPACASANPDGWGDLTTPDIYHIHGYVAEGKIGVRGEDGYYTIVDGSYEAKTATQCYATIDAAIAAAQESTDKTVLVLSNSIAWADTFEPADGVIIKLADGVTGATAPAGYEWNAEGVLVVKIVNWIQVADTSWYNAEEPQTAYTIDSAEKLAGLAELVNEGNNFAGKTITLTADINLGAYEWTPIGTSGKSFAGTFDGGETTISNLTINESAKSYQALFGYVKYDAEAVITFANVTLTNVNVTGKNYVAGLIADAFCVNIDNCHVNGDIYICNVGNNNYTGAIAGHSYANITNCSAMDTGTDGNGTIQGCYSGGIAGWTGEGNYLIANCVVENIDFVEESGTIVGLFNAGVMIKDCSAKNCTINANTGSGLGYTGLIAGDNRSSAGSPNAIINCTLESVTGQVTISGASQEFTQLVPAKATTAVGTGVIFDTDPEAVKVGTSKITAGVFTSNPPAKLLADGAVAIDNGDGTWTVMVVVATIGEGNSIQYFSTLQGAIDAVENNTAEPVTMQLACDVDCSATVFISNKNIIINGNDHTVFGKGLTTPTNGTGNRSIGFLVSGGNVTIQDMTITDFDNCKDIGLGSAIKIDGNADFTATNLKISEFTREGIIILSGTLTATDCVIDCAPSAERTDTKTLLKGLYIGDYYGDTSVTAELTRVTILNADSTYSDWKSAAIEIYSTATVTIDNCSIETSPYGIYVDNTDAKDKSVTITGETSVNSGATGYAAYIMGGGTGSATVKIDSGDFTGYTGYVFYAPAGSESKFEISGGTYASSVPQSACANGFAPETITDENGNILYYTVKVVKVATSTVKNEDGTETTKEYATFDAIPDGTQVSLVVLPSSTDNVVVDSVTKGNVALSAEQAHETAEVFGGLFTVEQIEDENGNVTQTTLHYDYEFGIVGVLAQGSIGKVTFSVALEENGSRVERTLANRKLSIVDAADKVMGASNANVAFDNNGTAKIVIELGALNGHPGPYGVKLETIE